ncbi:MAG TPA: hypothetical protein VEK11_09130 [Thermoanaerobaculia bacterium]|jgi:hypothetical protein|nr:hypothetical protein [Thermoanaerobaculia bacterium]
MQTAPSPATVLHDVVVMNEQTRVSWHAGHASIDNGAIVVKVNKRTTPPEGMFERAASTFTIVAADGGQRMRRFVGVKYNGAASDLIKKCVFT